MITFEIESFTMTDWPKGHHTTHKTRSENFQDVVDDAIKVDELVREKQPKMRIELILHLAAIIDGKVYVIRSWYHFNPKTGKYGFHS